MASREAAAALADGKKAAEEGLAAAQARALAYERALEEAARAAGGAAAVEAAHEATVAETVTAVTDVVRVARLDAGALPSRWICVTGVGLNAFLARLPCR